MLRNPQTTHVFVRQDVGVPLLHPAYKGPYKVLQRSEKFFVLDYITHTDRVSIDRLKPSFFNVGNILNASSGQSTLRLPSPTHTSEFAPQVITPRDNETDDYGLSVDTSISGDHSFPGTPEVNLPVLIFFGPLLSEIEVNHNFGIPLECVSYNPLNDYKTFVCCRINNI